MRYLLLLTLILLSCSGGDDIAGGSSSETTSGIIVFASMGKISGKAVKQSEIMLYSSSYNPVRYEGYADTLSLSNSDEFCFDTLKAGEYNLYAKSLTSGKKLFISSISVKNNGESQKYSAQFDLCGKVDGSVVNKSLLIEDPYVGLLGTPFTVRLNEEIFSLNNIPVGNYEVLIDSPHSKNSNKVLYQNVLTITADKTTDWKE